MLFLHVQIHVRPEAVEAFQAATLDNARHSVREPGCLRFDVGQSEEDPTRFALFEVYRDAAALDAHRQSAHFARWRETAEPLMAAPRQRALWRALFFKEVPEESLQP